MSFRLLLCTRTVLRLSVEGAEGCCTRKGQLLVLVLYKLCSGDPETLATTKGVFT